MQESTIVKPESTIKQERVEHSVDAMYPCVNLNAPPYKVIDIGNGHTAIDLDCESETVHLESSQASMKAQASSGKAKRAGRLFVSDDEDDIYVVETRPVKRRKC